jgi:hypothetical protein
MEGLLIGALLGKTNVVSDGGELGNRLGMSLGNRLGMSLGNRLGVSLGNALGI